MILVLRERKLRSRRRCHQTPHRRGAANADADVSDDDA
jgi:hypothetical protein